jgi:predicted secreted protein
VIQVFESDDGGDVTIAVGATLELALPEVSGTGFRWTLTSRGEPVLALEKEDYVHAKAPGSPRMHRWRFRAGAAGTTRLELVYARAWERTPARRFVVTVRAEPAS